MSATFLDRYRMEEVAPEHLFPPLGIFQRFQVYLSMKILSLGFTVDSTSQSQNFHTGGIVARDLTSIKELQFSPR